MISTSDIAQYLDITAFPATRDEIIMMAAENGAPDNIMDALSRLPDGIYDNVHEVYVLANAPQQ